MDEPAPNLLSKILRKRVETLGYTSLKKFTEDREDVRYSSELLRQVVYGARVPRAETLLSILQAMRFSPLQIHKLMDVHFEGYPGGGIDALRNAPTPPDAGEQDLLTHTERQAAPQTGSGAPTADPTRGQTDLLPGSPGGVASGWRHS